MRYLTVVGQDRSGNDKIDTVNLYFYQKQGSAPDQLIHHALAVDLTGDAKVDVQCAGDIDFDGNPSVQDRFMLKQFADDFLKLKWLNQHALMRRILTLSVEHFGSDGTPSSVRLEFTEQLGLNGRTVTTYKAAAYDSDGDHVLDTFSDIDVDKNGIADEVDRSLIDELSRGFLKFNWYQAPAACGH